MILRSHIALEDYRQLGDHVEAIRAVKYMCLCKILTDGAAAVPVMLSTKEAAAYSGPSISAVKQLAKAFEERSLKLYNEAIEAYKAELVEDPVVDRQQQVLKDKMIQKEISRILEPYNEVELSYVTRKVRLNKGLVEKTIATMILDKTIRGCIDQQTETVIIYDEPEPVGVYKQAVVMIGTMNTTIDDLYTYATRAPKVEGKEEKSGKKKAGDKKQEKNKEKKRVKSPNKRT
ncbi:hypothetical protein WR25_12008 [Diploscapter pachys]|uniref:PCI domain-containing protein n=1 Tax=Diploscapter pachys TaxID=2018661 RepID=A0A2A2KHL7_9BILA|nr:hypothetical protein WR25_12008 [Diploscapter pachys]